MRARHSKHAHIKMQTGQFATSKHGCTKLKARCSPIVGGFNFFSYADCSPEAAQHVVSRDHPLSCFLSSFQRCIDLSLFTLCTTSHNAGHFLRLILGPCLVIRDNCQLSQGTIRSITPQSMKPLGLNSFHSFGYPWRCEHCLLIETELFLSFCQRWCIISCFLWAGLCSCCMKWLLWWKLMSAGSDVLLFLSEARSHFHLVTERCRPPNGFLLGRWK